MREIEQAYIGRDNVTRRVLTADGATLTSEQQQAVTRVQVRIGDICIDTQGSDPITYSEGSIDMQLGLLDLTPGFHEAQITVYTPEHVNGKAWGKFVVRAIDWPVCD